MLSMIQWPPLAEQAEEYARAYRDARPFKHVVFDDLLSAETCAALAAAFPPPEWPGWDHGRGQRSLPAEEADVR